MKNQIRQAIKTALLALQKERHLSLEVPEDIHLENTKDKSHGDFASNIALTLTKAFQCPPRELAELIVANLPSSPFIKRVEIAGPGFINFFLSDDAYHTVLEDILKKKENFGRSDIGKKKKVHIEFVSANPTGPLHVGHGRGAAYGAALADLLAAVGYDVHREYYVNDAGRQMDILATSVWLRYLELCGETFPFPSNAYRGAYVIDIAKMLYDEHVEKFKRLERDVFKEIPADETQTGGDKEAHIDGLIVRAKILLGEDYEVIFDKGIKLILTDIREDLAEFGVHYQEWFSEKSLEKSGATDRAVAQLKEMGYLYEREGATWFRSTDFGDDKDRVVLRANGQTTYFASDIAYHLNKYERGFDQTIDVLGADHHGYAPRIKAILAAFKIDPATFMAPLVQFAILYRGKERVQMSTRSGEFITLRELRQEVGNDAARFFYVWRKCEQHMDFDLELAKSQSNENPMYYIQYAHARICSVFRQMKEKNWQWDCKEGLKVLNYLKEEQEKNLMVTLSRYPEVVLTAALHHEPHSVAHYLRELATDFHAYYNNFQFLVDDASLRNARVCLVDATRQVVQNGLKLLGVSAPESM